MLFVGSALLAFYWWLCVVSCALVVCCLTLPEVLVVGSFFVSCLLFGVALCCMVLMAACCLILLKCLFGFVRLFEFPFDAHFISHNQFKFVFSSDVWPNTQGLKMSFINVSFG